MKVLKNFNSCGSFNLYYFSAKRSSLRKTGSIRKAEKRRTITGDPKGKDKGKGDIYTKVKYKKSFKLYLNFII